MMKAKFTKGDWFINELYSTTHQISSVDMKTDICAVDCGSMPDGCEINPSEEEKANAHLIASAPKLYAMLETLIGNYQVAASIAEHEGYETNYEQDKVLADFLLAEARGE